MFMGIENSSFVSKVVLFLKENKGKAFTAREMAVGLIGLYPDYFRRKRENSQQNFPSENSFISQIVAEIGARKKQILYQDAAMMIQDKPRPRTYCYQGGLSRNSRDPDSVGNVEDGQDGLVFSTQEQDYSEADLYPLLMEYLRQECQLLCSRIDEKCSRKDKGRHANHWLHPDIVAMQPVTEEFHALVKNCVQASGGRMAYLWSFEVKKQITRSLVRQYFFRRSVIPAGQIMGIWFVAGLPMMAAWMS